MADDRDDLKVTKEKFLSQKLGSLLSWKKPEIRKNVGPYLPEVFEKYDQQRRHVIAECKQFLDALGDNDLNEISSTPRKTVFLVGSNSEVLPDGVRRDEWRAVLRNEIDTLRANVPSWLAGGFGHPDYRADFDYWGQMENFKLHEALVLSVGVEPKHIGERKISEAIEKSKKDRLLPPLNSWFAATSSFVDASCCAISAVCSAHNADAKSKRPMAGLKVGSQVGSCANPAAPLAQMSRRQTPIRVQAVRKETCQPCFNATPANTKSHGAEASRCCSAQVGGRLRQEVPAQMINVRALATPLNGIVANRGKRRRLLARSQRRSAGCRPIALVQRLDTFRRQYRFWKPIDHSISAISTS